jgi:transcription-repair coupling factor (superfamily II helicase)
VKVKDFLKIYRDDSWIQTIAERAKAEKGLRIHLKNLVGSLDAVIVASLFENIGQHQVFVLNDKEEAHYFLNDLQNLIPDKEILFFPTSYKKPYKFEETENANILMRAEVLSKINNLEADPELIVTYPEALTEKVINKRSLLENTFAIKIGDKLDINFLSEVLHSYEFEKTDFVYEAGQFSIRGGIIDIYSYSNDLPYRLELFGDEIESIRSFDPNTQLSVETKKAISIIPNVQTKMLKETRESLFHYLADGSKLWFKDVGATIEVIDKSFNKVTEIYQTAMKESGGSPLLGDPLKMFETAESFKKDIENFSIIEFGKQFYLKANETYTFNTKAQPSFNKEFKLLVQDLKEYEEKNYSNILFAESHQQMERLGTIFEELDPDLKFQSINVSLRQGFIDDIMKVVCYTDHQILDRHHRYKGKEKHSKSKSLTLKELRTLHPGDFVTHADFGIARFVGLEKVEVGETKQEAIRLIFKDDDIVLVSIHALHKISRYSGKEGGPPQLSKLGSGDWDNKKKKVKRQIKDIAKDLINLYAKRKAAPGYAFTKDSFMQAELESSFIYEDTPDQAKSTADVKADMEKPHPMDRLVCGDVGFGKTEIAIRAAFKAVADGKQVAVLVPTTILAMQHYKTFKERLKNFPCVVEYVNRFKNAAQIKETLKRVEDDKTQILIGTHRIISKDVKFKNLGLLIIDEEQKFGVKVKERLKEFKVNVDTLTLTATPIPRTLHFSLMGARDLSIIATPPPNRQPVTTEIHVHNEEVIRDAMMHELKRGGQVFFVHNRVKDIEEIADMVLRLVPDAKVGIAHGQMEGDQLEKVMLKFVDGDYDVLVSTNIIESGLDIPNANTIIINRAHMFGLSDLHQMRGRVGRSNKKAYCFLLTPPLATLPSDSRKRLSALEEFSELGDGFKVAMRDLDIRGAGNLLGAEQSGFISDVGYEMYHKILDETIQELKETEFKELFENELKLKDLKPLVSDCIIETDLSVVIPDNYVTNISERLGLYSTLDSIKNEEELEKFQISLVDRFGPLPSEVDDLIQTVRLRWKAEILGFEKLILKGDTLKAYFVSPDNEKYYKSDIFGKVLQYIQLNSKKCKLKDLNKKLILTIEDVPSIQQAIELFENIVPTKEETTIHQENSHS